MSWVCGMGRLLADLLWTTPTEAHVVCDGCGATRPAFTKRGLYARWARTGRAPPGWELIYVRDDGISVSREDYCPACRRRRAKERR